MTTGFSCFKKRIAILSVLCMIVTMMPISTFAADASDISSHWAKDQIQSWMNNGLIKGYSDGTFKPDNNITRAEFMALVNRAFEYTAKDNISYSDVSASAWYTDVIAEAKAAGYISGYADNTMRPNSPITREEAASIISKIDYLQVSGTETPSFTDSTALTWSKDFVIGASAASIMTGYSDGSFKPQNNIKRGEAVVALNRALSYSKNDTVYSTAGTYGPGSGNLAVAGNVTVVEKGTKLQNMTIAGNLIISRNVGDGDITLSNVTVKGQTYVYGGGQNSIIVIDSTLGKVTVSKENGKIRIIVSGNTTIGQVLANSGVKLEEGVLSGNAAGFQEITLEASDNDSIILIGSFTEVNVDVAGMNIEIPAGSTVTKLVLDKQSTVTGTGTVTSATINASGVTFETAPKTTTVATGVTAPTVGTTPTTEGGGGGGSSSVAVSDINITGTGDATTITTDNGTLQMLAAVLPANATNSNVTWSVTPVTGTATISATGLLTAVTNGIVNLIATSVSTGDIYGTKEITLSNQLIPSAIVFTSAGPIAKTVGDAVFTNTVIGGVGAGAITYVSGTPATATVNAATGEVIIVAEGSTVITATKAGTGTHAAATNTYTMNVAAGMTDVAKVAADVALIEAGTYEIPLAEQGSQAAKTAWVQSAADALIANGSAAVVTFNLGAYDVAVTLNAVVDEPATIAVTEEVMTDAAKVAADVALIEAGTYEIPLAEQGSQAAKTAWVQSAADALIANGSTAVVTFNLGAYDVAVTLNAVVDEPATIAVTEEVMTDAAKVAADVALIEAGTYEIPLAEQGSQAAKTAWVQGAADALIANGSTAVVTFNLGAYDVAVTLNAVVDEPATIAVTEEVMTDAAKVAADVALIEAGTYEIPLAEQGSQAAKTAWVQGAADALIANGSTAVVTFNLGAYDVAVTLNAVVDEPATIAVTEEVMTDAAKVAADVALIEAGTYEIPLAEQGSQAAKTAWVQGAADALIANGSTAVVTFNLGAYDVAVTLNAVVDEPATIAVTEAV